jgi:CheY-like chemotaxis protein
MAVMRDTIASGSSAARTVLVVDDDPDELELMRQLLGMAGYRVRTAAGGFQAIEMVGADMPDAMVLDLMMPDRSGIEVLEYLRFDPRTSKLPVICFSAVPQTEESLAFVNEFSVGLVDKTEWQELVRRLNELFQTPAA